MDEAGGGVGVLMQDSVTGGLDLCNNLGDDLC